MFISRKKYSPSCGEQPFDRAGRAVGDRSRSVDGERADPRAQVRVDCGRGRLLDELLVAPLDGAVALAEMDDVAVAVREDLHLDVARVVEVALDVDGGVREVRLALPLRGLEGTVDVVGRAGDAEPLPAATGRRLDRDRVADLLGGGAHVGGASRQESSFPARPERRRRACAPAPRSWSPWPRSRRPAGRSRRAPPPRRHARRRRSRRGSRSRDGWPPHLHAVPPRSPDRRGDTTRRPARARAGTPRRRRPRAGRRDPRRSTRRRPRSRARGACA